MKDINRSIENNNNNDIQNNNHETNEDDQTEKDLQEASKALSDCMFSQYAFTVAGVSLGTGYALYGRPIMKKKLSGVGLMFVCGGAGTLMDLAYGYTIACKPHMQKYNETYNRKQQQQQKTK